MNAIRDNAGNNIAASPFLRTSFSYTGREYEQESGLYYYRARYYDPGMGRFLQQDPAEGQQDVPITLVNKYAYVANSPVMGVDPSGKVIDYGGYVLTNPHLVTALEQVNSYIVAHGVADSSFAIVVTGGDRYLDAAENVRSLTNDSLIASGLNSPHLLENGARAVDFNIIGLSEAELLEARQFSDFAGGEFIGPEKYINEPHYHMGLPKNNSSFWGPFKSIAEFMGDMFEGFMSLFGF